MLAFRRPVPGAAAAAPGERRAGGALSRGARAVARRRRSSARSKPAAPAKLSRGAGAAPSRAGDRGVLARRRIAPRRGGAAAGLRRQPGAVALARWSVVADRSGVLRQALGAMSWCRASGGGAVLDRGEPGNATVPKGFGPDHHRELLGFEAEDADADDAPGAGRQVRADSAGAQRRRHVRRRCCSTSTAPIDYFVEADGVRIARLHDEGRGRAVRAADRARVSLPGLYRARAAEDRGRRRHRGAEGHRGARPGVPDDEDHRPAGWRSTTTSSRPGAAAGRVAHGQIHRRQATASTASSWRRRPASASPRRRSTRSTCWTDQPPTVSFSKPGPRHHGVADRGGVRRGQGRRRLRRPRPRAGLLGQRRRGEDGQAVRRPATGCPK